MYFEMLLYALSLLLVMVVLHHFIYRHKSPKSSKLSANIGGDHNRLVGA
ncbi:MAG: hypothetical protein HHJ09_15510 [Glaciimonas sp.]|nr:hypothetical protein [Glaciimonas sp.]